MTKISRDDVQHLAQLSSLQLPDEEAADLQVDLENILKYVEQLGELDTTGVEPTYQVTGLSNVWRDDVVIESSVKRETLLSLTALQSNDQINVPKVL